MKVTQTEDLGTDRGPGYRQRTWVQPEDLGTDRGPGYRQGTWVQPEDLGTDRVEGRLATRPLMSHDPSWPSTRRKQPFFYTFC